MKVKSIYLYSGCNKTVKVVIYPQTSMYIQQNTMHAGNVMRGAFLALFRAVHVCSADVYAESGNAVQRRDAAECTALTARAVLSLFTNFTRSAPLLSASFPLPIASRRKLKKLSVGYSKVLSYPIDCPLRLGSLPATIPTMSVENEVLSISKKLEKMTEPGAVSCVFLETRILSM